MRKRPNQQGVGTITIVVLLVIAGIIGCTAWYVIHAKNQSNDAQKQTERATGSSDGNRSGRKTRAIEYAKVPPELQAAILATTKADTPNCVKGDAYVGTDGKARTPAGVNYMATKGFAVTALGCDGNKDDYVIFVKQQDNSWKKAAATVDGKAEFKCADLTANKVPSSLIRASLADANAGTREVRCIPDNAANGSDIVYVEKRP